MSARKKTKALSPLQIASQEYFLTKGKIALTKRNFTELIDTLNDELGVAMTKDLKSNVQRSFIHLNRANHRRALASGLNLTEDSQR